MERRIQLLNAVRRFLVVAAFAFWMGGFTFYSGVVIEIAATTLRSHRASGFITQQVTHWINIAGMIALAVFLWNVCALWPRVSSRIRIALTITWAVLLATLLGLIIVHGCLDKIVEASTHSVLDEERFASLHQVYLITSTVQWSAALIHMFTVVMMWNEPSPQATSAEPS